MNYILAVEGSQAYNIETKQSEYTMKMVISEDVYDWLCSHDIEYTDSRQRIFICNNLRYVDLGPEMKDTVIPLEDKGYEC